MKYLPTLILLSISFCLGLYFYKDYQSEVKKIQADHYRQNTLDFETDCAYVKVFFDDFYKNLRAISLLPDVKEISHPNLPKGVDSAVKQGWFSPRSEATIQQIYNILALSVPVSEIYCVRDGFQWQAGETPFFMYDNLILGGG